MPPKEKEPQEDVTLKVYKKRKTHINSHYTKSINQMVKEKLLNGCFIKRKVERRKTVILNYFVSFLLT